MRDGARRLGPVLWVVAALGVGTAFIFRPAGSHVPDAPPPSAGAPISASSATASGSAAANSALAQNLLGKNGSKWPTAASIRLPAPTSSQQSVQAIRTVADQTPAVTRLSRLRPADLLVVAPGTLPASLAGQIRRMRGVIAAQRLDAGSLKVNGQFIQMLGVNPSRFRAFAARPTARSTALWRSVAAGDIAVSYSMGREERLKLGSKVHVAGARPEDLRVGGYGTVGISGVDAVVSDSVATSLGIPSGNAVVVSAPHARLARLMHKIKKMLPRHAAIAQLVSQIEPGQVVESTVSTGGAAGATSPVSGDGPPITAAQVHAFLKAALSRVGLPYVWGAAGPRAFDCSGLVQWSMRQAGITMPRVAVDQATTGPQVPMSALRPGDLLFYHTDPTAPTYISHVAIYLGNGLMEQAPEPGMDVQVVKAVFGAGFAGAIEVYPDLAASVAGNPAG
ncbi:MAG TPA: NlpC/P60 family protein [Streptosporangiaceae bacterium]|nr:NlpC/P60 family protein [Streptosporangiaceae bacterium]